MFYSAPTYNIDTDEWTNTEFETRKLAVEYIDSQFKYPGEYNLKYTEGLWNEQGNIFLKTGRYPVYVSKSTDFKNHWDFEKRKSHKEGFIIYKKPSEGIEFAVPGLYYWYLNYCPITDKVKKDITLPEIYDGDYHYFLYILRCILKRKFGVVLKKRQSGYSLKNMAILLNAIWFGKGIIVKIFASDESKVKDSWKSMEIYRDHINTHCGWKRGFDPTKILDWEIRRKRNDGSYVGNRSKAKGFTTKQDPTNGVGGAAEVIFGEESGINDTLDITHEYITSNASLGGYVTGLIIYSGAVGELERAEPLKKYILNPSDYDFLGCPNNIEEDFEYGKEVGFFAPEWWNYVTADEETGEVMRCYDKNGNTNKELAMTKIMQSRKKAKDKEPKDYRYFCSQRPLSIREAFDMRKESMFPVNLIAAQKRRIENKEYPYELVDLYRDETGKVKYKLTSKVPIKDFPVPKKLENKEGACVMHERPIEHPEFGKTYYGSIDPVGVGKTNSSESLCSLYIYKADVVVNKESNGEIVSSRLEPGKLVFWWCGRFDDLNKTHEQLEMALELYNAWAVVENNIAQFILYMIGRKKQKYLVPKDRIVFLKDVGANTHVYQDYGWKNTGNLFHEHLIKYAIDFLKEEIDHEVREDGEIMRTTYGVERIPDIMLLKEMEMYQKGMNVDRLISFCALIAFVKIQQANVGVNTRVERDSSNKNLENSNNLYKLKKNPFRNMGQYNFGQDMTKPPRSSFKNLR